MKNRQINFCSRNMTSFCSLFLAGIILSTVVLFRPVPAPARQARETIIFLPFAVGPGAGDLAYLGSGLTSMLATRVASRSETVAQYQNRTTRQLKALLQEGRQKEIAAMLKRSGASYLIVSSLDREKDHYLLTSYVFSRKQAKPYVLSRPVPDPDQIVPVIDRFAWDIVTAVFGKKAPAVQQDTGSVADGGKGVAAFQTAHPERAYRQGLYTDTGLSLTGEGVSLVASYRSKKIPFSVQAMDAADIDGDGTAEIALASNTELLIYQFKEEHFKKLATISLERGYLRVHALHLADLDGNGTAEIYISASNGDTPASMVLTWERRQARFLHRDVPYYIRPEVLPNGTAALLGQPAGSTGPLGDTIYRLVPDRAGRYVRQEKITLPAGLNIFDFIRTDLDGDGRLETVAIDTGNHLQVFDSKGEKIWQSAVTYCAGNNYFGTLSSTREAGRRTYIPTPLIGRDLDRDGGMEIIVGRNRLATFPYFKRLRYFEGSSVVALTWKDRQLTPAWETRRLAGTTPGYQVLRTGDDQDTVQLVFAEIETGSPFFFWESDTCRLHLLQFGKSVSSMSERPSSTQ